MFDENGYGRGDLSWTFIDPATSLPVTKTFESEYQLIGDRAYALVNAAKRKNSSSKGKTIQNVLHGIGICAQAIAKYAPDSQSPEMWADAVICALKENQSITEGSRWTYCNRALPIIREVSRLRGDSFHRRNPFIKHPVSDEALVHGEQLDPLINRARKDALRLARDYRNPPVEHIEFIQQAKALLKRGLFIPGDGAQRPPSGALLLARKWNYRTGADLSDLTMYLYPSAWHLTPFLILLSYALAANPDSLSSLTRDAISEMNHPSRGPLILIDLNKPRAGGKLQYPLRDAGPLSPGWLLRVVLEMTAPLIDHAPDRFKNYVFLCGTNTGSIRPLNDSLRGINVKRYVEASGVPYTTLKALRPARMTDEWNRTRDPFRVRRLGGHSSLSMTAMYILRIESAMQDKRAIANVQAKILRGESGKTVTIAKRFAGAKLASHTCADPFDISKPKDENGFCASYLWPFNDSHFILVLEPKPVSYLLRDYRLLCEAEKSLPPERYHALYSARKKKIETDYLPLINSDLFAAAMDLVEKMPAGPTVASL